MTHPPTYEDIGKSARDLFSKGYHYGAVKLEVKTTATNGMEFKAGGQHNNDSGKASGFLETKYKWKNYGATLTDKWTTDNILSTEVTIEDQILQGLKLAFDTSFAPMTGKKSGKVKTAFKNEYFNVGCDVDFNFAGPQIHGSAVAGYLGYLLGYQMCFDTAQTKFTKNNFTLGYSSDDFQLVAKLNDGSEYSGSLYQKISESLQTGVSLSWSSTNHTTNFAIGAKYIVDKNSSVNAKVNNSGHLGFGYTVQLHEGVKSTLSCLLDCQKFNQGGHKVGLCLEFEA